MNPPDFALRAMTSREPVRSSAPDWLWYGYLARGNITLLTGRWKVGKTTFLAGLLSQLTADGRFLDRPCRAAKAVVVSEETHDMWAARLKALPVGSHAQLLARPFLGRPTPDEWNRLMDQAERMRASDGLDLLVVDPLASFLPGGCESDPGSLHALLHPLRRLGESGTAILILHHPRKATAAMGCSARGGRALLGLVDIILELSRHETGRSDETRRRLVGLSCYPETPPTMTYEWEPDTAEFRTLSTPLGRQFRGNWEQVKLLLTARVTDSTHADLLDDWPSDQTQPTKKQLYHWLNRAVGERLAERTGSGTKSDPYRFRVASCDMSEVEKLPELRPMDEL